MINSVANCESRGTFCFVRFSLPHKPRALCGWCKSDIKTDKTVMGFGRNNYLLNIIYHDTDNRNAFGIFCEMVLTVLTECVIIELPK